MAKKIRVWDGSAWQDVAPALPYTAVHSAQASMPTTGIDGQVWLDTDGDVANLNDIQLKEVVFNSSNAAWTIPAGVTGILALVVGGGGGGGASSTATPSNASGGGGAGQVVEKFFTISGGDTTLNITVGNGGAGATTQGAKGNSGSASSIVGNTSATTYVTAAGGGGGGGGANANIAGLTGASAGGNGSSSTTTAGGGGGFRMSAVGDLNGEYDNGTQSYTRGGGTAPTSLKITGTYGGSTSAGYGGEGINIWDRALAGGGNAAGLSANTLSARFGAAASVATGTAGGNATANTGAGGGGARTSTSSQNNGGNGGSGLIVLRYVG